MPDKADEHKACILKAADDYYKGRTADGGSSVMAIRECFNEALKDGSAEELFRKLRTTSLGSPNVEMHRNGNTESLDITAGFWELGRERESLLTFKVTADLAKKSADVTTQTFTFTMPDWLKQ